jgi:hypothetical protein
VSLVRPVSGLDAIRMLLVLGFRVVESSGSDAALERDGRTVYLPRDEELSDALFAAVLGAARIDGTTAGQLLARLRCRDTLPDTGVESA